MPRDKRDVKIGWIDNLVGVFSPKRKALRLRYKAYNAVMKRKYEGADTGRRTAGWNTTSTSATTEGAGALIRLRNRSRDLVRNNPYAKRGIHLIANNVIGKGIKTQWKTDTDPNVSDEEKSINLLWRAWAETTACDYEGRKTLASIQRLAMKNIAESGEVFIRKRREGVREVSFEGQKVLVPAFSLQILESDFLQSDRSPRKLENGNTIKQGIELDSRDKRVAYHLYQEHPGDIGLMSGTRLTTTRVDARDVYHLYEVDRAGQLRGIPWLAAVMLRLRDFDLFEDATLKRQQCAAMFVAFVHDMEGFDEFDDADDDECELGEKMEPGRIEELPPGKDIKLSDPPNAEGYDSYSSVVLHSIATGLGLTYNALTSNLSKVNFSSGRMGWLEMMRNIDTWRKDLIIDPFMVPLIEDFREEAEIIGRSVAKARAVHTSPRREMIDPTKEVPALQTAVRSGFKTLSEVIREQGHDPDTHFRELKDDKEKIDKLGLVLDSDASNRQDSSQADTEEINDDD